MKKLLYLLFALLLIIGCASCSSSESSSSYQSKYSDDYNNDPEYRKNVDEAAEIWGEDAADVDAKIQAVAGADS